MPETVSQETYQCRCIKDNLAREDQIIEPVLPDQKIIRDKKTDQKEGNQPAQDFVRYQLKRNKRIFKGIQEALYIKYPPHRPRDHPDAHLEFF
ncbi:MAG TPA: hypothetical protein VMW95_09070 [Desulfobacterales bacterium]|nr:hypothetical protein [Desulfobacterales bacterium]